MNSPDPAPLPCQTELSPFVGLQIEHRCFHGREPAAVLDEILERVPINALMVFHGWQGRWSEHWASPADDLESDCSPETMEKCVRNRWQQPEKVIQEKRTIQS